MVVVHQDLRGLGDVGTEQLAALLREAGGAEHDYLPEERVPLYLSRLGQGGLSCIVAVQDRTLGAALLYSSFGPLHPVPGSFLRLEGLYVEEVVVTRDWRRNGWSRRLLAELEEVEGAGCDIYIDCDAANDASVAMMRTAGYAHVVSYDDPGRAEPPARGRITSQFRRPAGHRVSGPEGGAGN